MVGEFGDGESEIALYFFQRKICGASLRVAPESGIEGESGANPDLMRDHDPLQDRDQ